MTSAGVPVVTTVSRAEACAAPGEVLERTGACVIRDGGINHAGDLAAFTAALGLAPVAQLEPFTARKPLAPGVWSGPNWPANAPMCMHHELGWQRTPPPHMLVACLRPPASGGRTGLADGRAVLDRLPGDLVSRARSYGWTLTRRYADGLISMGWLDAFPGMDAQAVEAYAADEGITLEWGRGTLVTRRTRPAIRGTDAPAWSNLLAFCSEWAMEPAVREFLVTTLGRDGLPFETCFGDGTPFTAHDVTTVNAAYEAVTDHVTLRAGDVLILDNARVAHSMEPCSGIRATAVVHAAPAVWAAQAARVRYRWI